MSDVRSSSDLETVHTDGTITGADGVRRSYDEHLAFVRGPGPPTPPRPGPRPRATVRARLVRGSAISGGLAGAVASILLHFVKW